MPWNKRKAPHRREAHSLVNHRSVLYKGFSELGVRRVVASALVDNAASRRVMETAGLKLARAHCITDDGLVDAEAVEYALERADWERQ